ncbi:hypothetical protein [Candidatus Burkholderia verschuerenii]|nr:hypothetical protein [Candidatus Burkholderia verschuerenii]
MNAPFESMLRAFWRGDIDRAQRALRGGSVFVIVEACFEMF